MLHAMQSAIEPAIPSSIAKSKIVAHEHPAVAGRLILSEETGQSQDPHVERLIEAFAFLTARLQIKPVTARLKRS